MLFPNLPITEPRKWIGHRSDVHGRNMSWTHPDLPGIEVRHCGHPTANRPYYIVGRGMRRKFYRLAEAQQAAMTGIEWPEESGQ